MTAKPATRQQIPMAPTGYDRINEQQFRSAVDQRILRLETSSQDVDEEVATYGTIATQDADAVAITGGTMSGVTITGGSVSGITDLAIADGGTGASSATAARSNLGLTDKYLDNYAGASDTAKLQAWAASGDKKLILLANMTLTAEVTLSANQILDFNGYTITKGFNGDCFVCAASVQFRNGRLDGEGGTYTGRGFVIATGGDQRWINMDVVDMNGYCAEFTASGAGVRSLIEGGLWQRTTATNAAIKWPTTDSSGDRQIANVACGGGVLVDCDGCDNGVIANCQTTNIILGTGARKVHVIGTRIANAAIPQTLTIQGTNHVFVGCIISGDVTLGADLIDTEITGCVIAGTFTDSAGNGTNNFVHDGYSFTPVWGGDGTTPAIGNGTLTGRVSRNGRHAVISIDLTAGGTTTFGNNTFYFQLPASWGWEAAGVARGSVYARDSGTGLRTGVVKTDSGTPKFYMMTDGDANFWSNSAPMTWASGDELHMTITIEVT